ncbi:hypothetical protein PHAVU_008G210814 [Phaseolus vulgaris]
MGCLMLKYLIIFECLLLHFPVYNCLLCNPDDKYALLQFKHSFLVLNSSLRLFPDCSQSSLRESWNNIRDCCGWDGVTCDSRSGHVIGLDLTCSDLRGELLGSNSSIFRLRHLQQLNLDYNDFSGSSIHSAIGDLVNLTHLTLSGSGITGDVPSTISHLSKLLYLHFNTIDLLLLNDPTTSYSRMRLHSCTWNKLIQNATNLKEIFLGGVNMSSVRESSLSLLTNLSSSLVSLYLLDTQIQAKLPTDILRLPNLQEIDLSYNENLRGQLPNSNWTTPLRFLSLSSTAFSGYIPDSIAHLKIRGNIPKWFHENLLRSWKNISSIDLSFNKLQGHLPIPPNGIEIFLVSNNELSGDISSALCNASTLFVLNLACNNLTGLIPECLGTFPSLWALDLQKNNLYGSLPHNFSKGNAFKTIKLNRNQLEGPLPQSLAHCTTLEVLDLGNNNIEDTFPYWLETLPTLQVLSLRSNKLHGVINSFGTKLPFPRLRIFDISNNCFTGPLPASYIHNFQGMMNASDNKAGLKYLGNGSYIDSIVIVMKGQYMELERILTVLTTIDLSNNMFEGEVPKAIGELHSLIGLNLSHNRITGTIPLTLANLSNLESLDLSWNLLKGEIPMALKNMNFLEVLNLSQNQFEGVIPTGGQFNTFENNSYVGNPMLCGIPLSKACNGDKERETRPTVDEEESGFGWKCVVVGYACGMMFGIILGYNVFFVGKPQWLARLVEVVLNVILIRTKNRNRANS